MSAADAVPATAANGPGATTAADRLALAGLLAIALAVRLAFYTGFFGSDEVTYVANAYRLLDGDWQVSSYVGSNRYGMNLPLAAMAFLFGRHEMVANAYPLLCSLGEVALVFHFGRQLLGLRAAVLGALLLALLPLHAHYAGRLMADAPLALMITASFLFFWHGERNGDRCSFVIAGLAAGCSFWIKPHAIIYLAVFAAYPLLARRWDRRWLLMAGACGLMIAANCLLFRFLSGDVFFLVEAMRSRHTGVDRAAAAAADPFHVSAGYYLVYLLARVYHTWIVFHLALAALFLWWLRRRRGATADDDAMRFLLWWAAGLLLVFSLFVASWNPFVLIPKQTNYMLMFVAPLALLAGHAAGPRPRRTVPDPAAARRRAGAVADRDAAEPDPRVHREQQGDRRIRPGTRRRRGLRQHQRRPRCAVRPPGAAARGACRDPSHCRPAGGRRRRARRITTAAAGTALRGDRQRDRELGPRRAAARHQPGTAVLDRRRRPAALGVRPGSIAPAAVRCLRRAAAGDAGDACPAGAGFADAAAAGIRLPHSGAGLRLR
ncbi:glycosyltransferase family 39 protein [Accumulibacter sp.]|jgi:hypothetical protein|uniref:ArnT family glycosyltransferase n=1 Tax=Accumulibacter sp. TaxID=2053492 RepID=UPI001AC439AB|nr:glycosyltransferase family 39 protein [Accumulibacter sp.]MBN8456165.1 glycosyltransferase family 39 protein [Accumulibacter sp.]